MEEEEEWVGEGVGQIEGTTEVTRRWGRGEETNSAWWPPGMESGGGGRLMKSFWAYGSIGDPGALGRMRVVESRSRESAAAKSSSLESYDEKGKGEGKGDISKWFAETSEAG